MDNFDVFGGDKCSFELCDKLFLVFHFVVGRHIVLAEYSFLNSLALETWPSTVTEKLEDSKKESL